MTPIAGGLLDLDSDQRLAADGVKGPAVYPKTDDDDGSTYATYSKALLEEQRASMEQLFLTWTQNLLMLAGLQWWSYDPATGAFRPPRLPSWREKPVRNLLVPYFKHYMAKATKNRPVTSAVAASTDPEDIHASQLGDDVIEAKWKELKRGKTLRRAVAWLIATGNAFIMPYWNSRAGILHPLTTLVEAMKVDAETGQPAVDPMTGAPMVEMVECPCDETGEPKTDEQGNFDLEAEPHYIDIGEVGDKVLSPYQVFFDAGAESEEDVTFTLIAESLTLREIYRRWPNAEGQVVAEDVSELERWDHLVSSMIAGADTHVVQGQTDPASEVPKATVLHYFEKQSEEYPHGRHWVTCGHTLLERAGPLPDGIWPVVIHLKDLEVPGRLHAEATMTHVVGLNREYNEINQQIKEHHNLLLRGKWLVPQGANIRRGQITTRPGEVIQHTPGLKPEMADLKPLPNHVYDEREKVLTDFQLITGLHRITMGDPPPGVTSGRAFLTLQEADDSDFGPVISMLEEAVAEWAWLTIQIIQRYYDEERLLRVSGPNHRFRVRAFKGADLSSIVDVEPQQGSAFPWSQTAKQGMMIELAQAIPDLFMDPETGMFDQERFRRLLPVGGEEAVGIGTDLDVTEAQREEEVFEYWDGTEPFPVVQPWQNHVIHARQHARTLKSATFESWPPEAREAFIHHWMAHQNVIAGGAAAMAQAEQIMGGGGAPGGGGEAGASEAGTPVGTEPGPQGPAGPPPSPATEQGPGAELSDTERDPTTG